MKTSSDNESLRDAKVHAQAIVALAAEADALIPQVRKLVTDMQKHAIEGRLAMIRGGAYAHVGRLDNYSPANTMIERMKIPADQPLPSYDAMSIEEIAGKAWSEVLEGRL